VDAANVAGGIPAKSAQEIQAIPLRDSIATMPALQQIGGIEFLLLAAQLFLLIVAALAGAQGFEDLAFTIGPMIFAGRLLARHFEFADVGPKFPAEVMQVLAENGSELEFGGRASGDERGSVGLCGIGEVTLQLGQCFLSTRDPEIGLLQLQRALAFDALTQTEQRGESETEGHASGRERHEAIDGSLHAGDLL